MAYTIAFFGSKPYDEASFNEKNSEYGFELRYYKGHLNLNNVILTQGVDAVCIFVNDTADAEVIRQMAANGVKLLALRCAGYNNVDLKAAAENGITVVRVPAYSPYAVAEYTVALMLSLNRKIPRATWRKAAYYHYYEYPAEHSVKRHYGIRTQDFKLIHFYNDIDEWEMYDMKADPREMNNVFGKPEYAEKQKELMQLLQETQKQYKDTDPDEKEKVLFKGDRRLMKNR